MLFLQEEKYSRAQESFFCIENTLDAYELKITCTLDLAVKPQGIEKIILYHSSCWILVHCTLLYNFVILPFFLAPRLN